MVANMYVGLDWVGGDYGSLLVSFQSNTDFKRYRPILGDMPKVINNLDVSLFTELATINDTVTKIVT